MLSNNANTHIITSTEGFNKNSNRLKIIHNTKYEIINDNIELHRLDYKFKLPYFLNSKIRIYSNLLRLLNEIMPDLIYINGLQMFDLYTIIKFKKLHSKVIIFGELSATFDNSAKTLLSKLFLHKLFYKKIIQDSLPYIDKIYYGSSASLTFSSSIYSTSVTSDILPLGVDDNLIDLTLRLSVDKLREKYYVDKDSFVFITGGKIDNNKKVYELIDAFRRIPIKKMSLIIFGDFTEPSRSLMDYINSDRRIRLLGWRSSTAIHELFRLSDVAVFPGSKSALWESAIAMGLPLIAQFWRGMEYIDFDGNIYYLLNNGDVSEIYRSMLELHNNIILRNNMSKIAKENGLLNLSYRNVANKILIDYQEFQTGLK
jgi:glycosyltransferase involved in cell wall biosynthesis